MTSRVFYTIIDRQMDGTAVFFTSLTSSTHSCYHFRAQHLVQKWHDPIQNIFIS